MVELSSGEKKLYCIALAIGIVAVLVNLTLTTNRQTLIALSAILAVLIFLCFYFFNFISLFLDDANNIILKKGGKKIEYLQINKISFLPVSSWQPGGFSLIFLITYTSIKGKTVRRLISVSSRNAVIVDRLKDTVNNAHASYSAGENIS